jgi:hypothetical protein
MADDVPGGFGGFAFPIPPELEEALQKAHDQAHMRAEATAARVDNFLATLDVDGCIAMRTILNTGDMKGSVIANFFDGQMVAMLRYRHHVDPETGEPDPLTTAPAPE